MGLRVATTSTAAIDGRKVEGNRRRRLNTNKLKIENTKLRAKISDLQEEVKRLNSLIPTTNEPSSPETSPTKVFVSNLSPAAKKRATVRMMDKKETLARGTISNVRKKFGINISNQYTSSSTSPSELEEAIHDFMCRDDISQPCPDKKKQINHQQIRYRLNHLTVLHQQFELETNIDVDYNTFRRYVPSFIIKPKVDDWGTCLCINCLNPQLKFDKLNQLKSSKPIIKKLFQSMSVDLNEVLNHQESTKQLKDALDQLKHEKFTLTYTEWKKVKTPESASTISKKVTSVATMEDFTKQFLKEIEDLEQHLERVHQQFKAAKQAKRDAEHSSDVATIQIDCAENYDIRQAQEEQGAYYYEHHISLHSGYVWTNCNSFSFCSISDCTNHIAEAAWCSIEELLNYLIVDQKKTINIISDSPWSQYRNKTTIYMLNRYATKYSINMKWIFLECGHGKGIADAISAQMKRKMDDCISFNPNKSYEKASDFINEIQSFTSIKIFTYDKTDVDVIKQQLPSSLKTVKGTGELHEILAQATGLIFGKKTSDQQEMKLTLKF
ncbi:unnamed protein product [Adineta steineri]|uniref:Uncharacterized protein n=1 Tax=Adineta steineri TaxID=433720 RepID=A0A819JNQ4_9BILA|nr:unnamed protein product [Adineta steineri]CAF1516473.1 unnamed protein product [Adineta steineri]CAF3873850.1 unnamed protein product [Adineta steineri]CAF3930564.1 unnamed protein product [Adineta steineri]